MSAKRNQQELHPRIVQYASLLGVEPQRFWLVLKGKEKVPDLLERFRAIRRLEYRPIPLKYLRGYGEKKARKSSAKSKSK